MEPWLNLTWRRLGERTSSTAEVETDVLLRGASMSTLFWTVIDMASIVCWMSPITTPGSRLRASTAMSSLLDVYASFHVPPSFSRSSVGDVVGLHASSCVISSSISARTCGPTHNQLVNTVPKGFCAGYIHAHFCCMHKTAHFEQHVRTGIARTEQPLNKCPADAFVVRESRDTMNATMNTYYASEGINNTQTT